jgi:hypothetical protein
VRIASQQARQYNLDDHPEVRQEVDVPRVIVDEILRNKLHNFTEPLELCDESGRVLAHLVPTVDLSDYEPWEPHFSDEELQRQEQSGERHYITAEVLAHLKGLENR